VGGLPQRAVRGQAKKLIAVARALYEQDDSDALAEFGFTEDDLAAGEIEVWACNAETVALFVALGSQWRVGMSGATGLDYCAIRATAGWLGVEMDRERFDDLRTMEAAALSAMAEARDTATARRR
jgi:hypothetical protein